MFAETPNLVIRDLELGDLPALLNISSDPDVVTAMDAYLPPDMAGLQHWLVETIGHNQQQPRTSHNCAIVLKANGDVIGWIGFGTPSQPAMADSSFGYALNSAYRNQGYMTEATKAILTYCFDMLEAQSVSASHKRFNTASGRVMQKAGMRLNATKEPAVANDDEVHYIITADEWRAFQNQLDASF